MIDTRQKKKRKEKTKGDNHHNINVSIQWVKNPNIDIHVVKLLQIYDEKKTQYTISFTCNNQLRYDNTLYFLMFIELYF